MLTYKGFRFDDVGVSTRWKRKPILLWNEVVCVITAVDEEQLAKFYRTVLQSTGPRSVSITCEKRLSSFSILQAYSRTLNFILSHVPHELVCDKTRFVAKWATDMSVTRETERAVKHDPYGDQTTLRVLANQCWVKLEYRKARRLFQQILQVNPYDTESLESMALIHVETGDSIDTVTAQYEHLLTLVPNSQRSLRMLALLLLESGDERGEEYARRLFEIKPDDVPTREILSLYYLRKGAFPKARIVIEQLKTVASNPRVKEFAEERMDYINRYETDERFRKKEKTRESLLKVWWFVGATVLPLLGLLFWLYSLVRDILKERGAP